MQLLKDKISFLEESLFQDFASYITYLYDNKKITELEYWEVQKSLETKNVKNFLATFASIEILAFATLPVQILVWSLLMYDDNGENMFFHTTGVFLSERLLRIVYSYIIADKNNLKNPLIFWIINSLPFWKMMTPPIWLQEDKEVIKQYTFFQKEKINHLLFDSRLQWWMRVLF